MPNRITKALKSIFVERNFHRIWQILLKSPLADTLAFLHGLWSPNILRSRLHLAEQVTLSDTQKQILSDLNENGFALADSLFDYKDFSPLEFYLTEKLEKIAEAKECQLNTQKNFWVRLSDSDFAHGVTMDHPLVQLSLKTEVLEVISRYLKHAPFLEYILLTYSLPSTQAPKASQLWHQDHDNNKMLKLFIYLSEVKSDADGPFTLLPKTADSVIRNSFFPKHLHDSEIESQFPLSEAIKVKGQRFSTFLVDTSLCYHMGSRVAEGHSRLMSTSLYVTLPKAYWGSVKNFVQPTGPTTPLQKAAIENVFGTKSE